MRQTTFVASGSERWRRIDELLGRVDRRGLRRLDGEELLELGALYRRLTSDLAYAHGRSFDDALVAYLNRLTTRAHAAIYAGGEATSFERVRAFFTGDFPREVRRSWIPIALCAVLFFGPWLIAFCIVVHDPSAGAAFFHGNVPAIKKSLHDSNFAVSAADAPSMSAYIIQNNVRIAVVAFAGGMTLGALTVFSLVYQGLFFGAYQAAFANAHFGYDFIATIAPHGALELSAITIAGGSGLLLAAGVLVPGRLPRKVALARNARRAGVLILGVCAMLCAAGLIEGFFSPRRVGPELRIGVGALTAVALAAYLSLAGRHNAPRALTSM